VIYFSMDHGLCVFSFFFFSWVIRRGVRNKAPKKKSETKRKRDAVFFFSLDQSVNISACACV